MKWAARQGQSSTTHHLLPRARHRGHEVFRATGTTNSELSQSTIRALKERSVSLTDLGWVIAAQRDVAASGGILDEARVNPLRYLEGTPKAATRWIDTGWAVRLLGAVA